MRARVLASVVVACVSACSPRPTVTERRLTIALPAGLHSTDVNDPTHDGYALSILGNAYETLVELQPDLTLRPGLAESWFSPDDVTWVFRLRRGVRFHDGRTLTPQDVVASFERARHNPWLRGETDEVVQVQTRGERDVVFKTRDRFDGLLGRLTYCFITGTPPGDGSPSPGTGPYRIVSLTPNGSTILEAVPGHRDGTPPIRVVEFQTVAEPAERAARLRRGEADVVVNVLPDEIASPPVRGITIATAPGLRVLFLAMDCAHTKSPYVKPAGNPFRDRRVREAASLAIDRRALVAGPLHGYGEPIEQLPNPTELGFDASVTPQDPDPAGASRLLAEAAPGGFDVDLHYMLGKYLAGEAVVKALAAQLARVGIRAVPRPLAPAEFLNRMRNHDMALYLLGWSNGSGSALETYTTLLHSPRDGLGAYNGGGYSNPALDRLLDDLPRAQAPAARIELLRAATRTVEADLPVIPLYRQKTVFAFTSEVKFDLQIYPRIRAAAIRWKE